ncbi:hypothetical protein HPY42_02240 [Coprothermobacteraceae bacterium]|nr:hypothetical protein [Coprothermobacteraceae bacterium]
MKAEEKLHRFYYLVSQLSSTLSYGDALDVFLKDAVATLKLDSAVVLDVDRISRTFSVAGGFNIDRLVSRNMNFEDGGLVTSLIDTLRYEATPDLYHTESVESWIKVSYVRNQSFLAMPIASNARSLQLIMVSRHLEPLDSTDIAYLAACAGVLSLKYVEKEQEDIAVVVDHIRKVAREAQESAIANRSVDALDLFRELLHEAKPYDYAILRRDNGQWNTVRKPETGLLTEAVHEVEEIAKDDFVVILKPKQEAAVVGLQAGRDLLLVLLYGYISKTQLGALEALQTVLTLLVHLNLLKVKGHDVEP